MSSLSHADDCSPVATKVNIEVHDAGDLPVPLVTMSVKREGHDVRPKTTLRDKLWMQTYTRLKAFKEAFGHCCVPASFGDKTLLNWVYSQRASQRANTLRKDRKQLLNDLGFTWSSPMNRKAIEHIRWMNRYDRLVAFKAKNGHFQVTSAKDRDLHAWMKHQRALYKSKSMRKEREELMSKIGFVWDVKKEEEAWNKMFGRLHAYFLQFGHTDIQNNSEDQELMQWVSLQRTLHKEGSLDSKREKDLCEIGMSWESQTASTQEAFPEMTPAPTNKNIRGASIAPSEVTPDPVVGLSNEAPTFYQSARHDSQAFAAYVNACATPSAPPTSEAANIAASSPETATSSNIAYETPKASPQFVIGTRIEKVFKLDGKRQALGGTVASVKQFEDEDYSHIWGYLVNFDDGYKELLFEAEVAKNLEAVKREKRAKRQAKCKSSKRAKKQVDLPGNDARLVGCDVNVVKVAPDLAKTSTSERFESVARSKQTENICPAALTMSDQGPVESRDVSGDLSSSPVVDFSASLLGQKQFVGGEEGTYRGCVIQ